MSREQYAQWAVNSAMMPSRSPGLGQSGPVYTDVNGNPISSIVCGEEYSFNVPGETSVFLEIRKDGIVTYQGPQAVPMPPYQAKCNADVGNYVTTAFDIQTGANLGSVAFTVQQGSGSGFAFDTNTMLMIGGGVLLLMLMAGKKR